MLLGHVAAGLAGKKFAPRVSLGTLVLAGTLSDLVFTVLVIAGVEHLRIVPGITAVNPFDLYDYPFSHGLLANVVMAILFGGFYFLIKKDTRSSIVLGLVVLSHWVLDVISHRPDMALIGNEGPKVGLGLWNSFAGSVAVELVLFLAGLILYLRATKPRRALSYLPLSLFILYSAFMFTGWLLGTIPENLTVVYISSGIMMIMYLALAYWTDYLREKR
jgi:hypothetical protein